MYITLDVEEIHNYINKIEQKTATEINELCNRKNEENRRAMHQTYRKFEHQITTLRELNLIERDVYKRATDEMFNYMQRQMYKKIE